jgi:hypothetical protein
MKFERKKAVLALLFVASLLVVLVWLLSPPANDAKPEPTIAPINISPEQITTPPDLSNPSQVTDNPSFRFSITKDQANLPDSVPLLLRSTKNPITLETALKIANAIGIDTEPITVKDPDSGTAYLWSGSTHALSIFPFRNQIEYTPSSGTQKEFGQPLTLGQYQSIAGNFLVNNFLVNQDLLKFASITYTQFPTHEQPLEETLPTQADLITVNITLNGPKYPIFTTDPGISVFSISMTRSGKIAKAISNFGYEYIEGSAQAELLSYDEIVKNMDSAVFVRLDEPTMTGYTLKERGATLANGTIDSIELVYLLDKPDAAILQPAFLMKGDVVLIDRGQSVTIPAQLYLPALRSLYN